MYIWDDSQASTMMKVQNVIHIFNKYLHLALLLTFYARPNKWTLKIPSGPMTAAIQIIHKGWTASETRISDVFMSTAESPIY